MDRFEFPFISGYNILIWVFVFFLMFSECAFHVRVLSINIPKYFVVFFHGIGWSSIAMLVSELDLLLVNTMASVFCVLTFIFPFFVKFTYLVDSFLSDGFGMV